MPRLLDHRNAKPQERPIAAKTATGDTLVRGQSGLFSGTQVATDQGWKVVEALCVGDKVLTFDNGMQPIARVHREVFWIEGASQAHALRPVYLPAGAFGNRADLWITPDQGLFVESDTTRDAMGDPFAVIPARAVIGYRDAVAAMPRDLIEVTIISFAGEEVIYVDGGLLVHCAVQGDLLSGVTPKTASLYDVMDIAAACDLVESMQDDEPKARFFYDLDAAVCQS